MDWKGNFVFNFKSVIGSKWSDFTNWTPCTHSCGLFGYQRRTRTCTKYQIQKRVQSQFPGCRGFAIDERSCNRHIPCPGLKIIIVKMILKRESATIQVLLIITLLFQWMVSGQHSVNGRIAQRLADQMEHSIGTDHAPVDLEEYHVRELQWKRGDVTAIFLV